jgi:hypothetical protein
LILSLVGCKLEPMRVRAVPLVVLAGLIGAGAVYAAAASGRRQIPVCSSVHVSGGFLNAATGGEVIYAVRVRNTGKRDCEINGRPWIRLGPARYAVTVADATPGMYGEFGAHERTLTLAPGQRAVTQVVTDPGSCTRGVGTMFSVSARAGWADRSVPVGSGVCKNGSGEIWVGVFQR